MIVLDTHIWVWWVSRDARLTPRLAQAIQAHQADGLGVSVISCWEVAKLIQIGRLQLTLPTATWLDQALTYPGIELFDLTLSVVVESTQLPGPFHRDPADQMIVATARIHGLQLLTVDEKILEYPHVQTLTL